MNKIRVAVDIDGVLRDFSGRLYEYMKLNYPESIICNEILDWDYKNCFKGWERKDIEKLYWEEKPEYFFRDALPLKNSIEQMKELFDWGKSNIEFVCISSQRTSGTYYSLEWLGKYKLTFREVHFISNSDKWKKDVDWIVDDSPKVYDSWIKGRGNDDNFIVMDAPYNRHINSFYRIHELFEIKKIIN